MAKKKTEVLPQLFEIKAFKANNYLLSAFGNELEEIGYNVEHIGNAETKDTLHFTVNSIELDSLKNFRNLTIHNYGGYISDKKTVTVFTLPNQWNEALEFASKQLKLKYWNYKKTFNINNYLVVPDIANQVCNVDKYTIPFSEVLFLYNIQKEYRSNLQSNPIVLNCKLGCQNVELTQLKELAEFINKVIVKEEKTE